MIVSHGGGGCANYMQTNRLAAELNMFVIYYSGPGRGPLVLEDTNSDGQGDTPISDGYGYYLKDNFPERWSSGEDHTIYYPIVSNNKFFDAYPDPRGSWMWGHSVAAMRAITLAAENDDIDMQNVAMIGGSAGGVATLLASSVDDRINVAVPSISSLALEDAVAFDDDDPKSYSWLNILRHCTDSGPDDTAPEWMRFIEQVVGKDALITRNSGPTLFLNGATEEFFP